MTRPRNLRKLLAVYRAIQAYQTDNHGTFPSFLDLVVTGVSPSNGDLTNCFESMHELNMLVYVRKSARSSHLLPEDKFAPEMKKFIRDNGL